MANGPNVGAVAVSTARRPRRATHHRLPGPLTPAADGVYQPFVMVTRWRSSAPTRSTWEQAVKWGETIKAIYATFAY